MERTTRNEFLDTVRQATAYAIPSHSHEEGSIPDEPGRMRNRDDLTGEFARRAETAGATVHRVESSLTSHRS